MFISLQETKQYRDLLLSLKQQLRSAQLRAMFAVNKELIVLYWNIGKEILQRQEKEGWGSKIIDRLSQDLKKEFPSMKGLSLRNLKYMRAFAEAWQEEAIMQQVAAQIPWFHNCVLIDKLKIYKERIWYASQAFRNGWSRNVLVHQIESDLYTRNGKAITNFRKILPDSQSDLAQQMLKDPYTFDFLTIHESFQERELEKGLITHIQEFLIELGVGFAFMGSQYKLEVSGKEYYVDLLFYHLTLRCFIVVDLKTGEFEPEFAGKMNFYLSIIDHQLKTDQDNASIGIILCKSKDRVIAEYALRDISKPMGITSYRLKLPTKLANSLPTVAQLERELIKGKEKE